MKAPFRTRAAASILALFLPFAGSPAFARQAPAPADSQIRALITQGLNDRHIAHVEVAVTGGVVTLDGMVQSAWEKEAAIDIAGKARGVKKVVSTLRVASAESDQAIARKLVEEVNRYTFYTVFDNLDASVQKGVVTLTGQVTAPFKANEIAGLVSRVHGVQKVDNRIEVLPISPADDQLRQSIASQIYGDPMFLAYAIQVNPPIHIVVKNGNVTLTGVVASEMEKQKAEMIARRTFGVFVVTNQLRVERGGK